VDTTNNEHIEVRELVALARTGDHAAYARLVERYKDSIYRLALRILRHPADAEDAVQDAFIKAYIHLDSYQDRYSFYTWLATIVTNVCYSALRARDWYVTSMPDQLLRAVRAMDRHDDPEVAILLRSRDEALRHAIQALPEKYRRILILRYWSDLSYQEVAEATGQTLGAVKSQIRRATQMLREALSSVQWDLVAES
jgi:RNA polymerase sigma-70 factor (ECF subfamily)